MTLAPALTRHARRAVTIGLVAWVPLAVSATAQEARAPVRVVAVKSEAIEYREALTLRGRTEADRRVDVSAEVEGVVASPPIRKGAVVAEGEPLCELAPGERPAILAEAEANLRQAQVEVEASRRLSERGFQAEIEALRREAELEAARAIVERARLATDRLTVHAPFDGVLETDTAELGSYLQPGTTCATLIALDPIALVGFAPERDVDRLEVGAPATARLVTGREVEGEIRFVARAADLETRTYRVEVAAPNADLAIRDGMTAELRIPLAPRLAHFLPQSALTLGDDGALGVRIVREGRAHFEPVATLSDTADGVWVEGLPDEADVIVVGQEYVGEGQPVDPTFREAEAL